MHFPFTRPGYQTGGQVQKALSLEGGDLNARKPPKAWSLVIKPKSEGDLGVLNLKTQNEALLLKNLDKFFNRRDIPWVKLIWENHYSNEKLSGQVKKGFFYWRDVVKLLDPFKGLAAASVQDGGTCFIWVDLWNDQVPKLAFPELYSFAKKIQISQLVRPRKVHICTTCFIYLCLRKRLNSTWCWNLRLPL